MAAAIEPPNDWDRLDTVAFNSARKWSAACFRDKDTWVMGAPDVLLAEDDPLRDRVQEFAPHRPPGAAALLHDGGAGRAGAAAGPASRPHW